MQPDLLPPEEDQQTRADDGLEEAYNKPAIEDFRRTNGPPPKMQQAQKAAGFVKKNKKWFYGVGGGLAVLIPIAMFFAWMMLFKNVHIKNLYVTYRWAQFNRGLNKALGDQIKYAKNNEAAKPTGSADTPIDPADSPENLSKNTNAADFDPDNIDVDDASRLEAEGKKVSSLEQSPVEGANKKASTDAKLKSSIKPTEGDTPEERAKSAKNNAIGDIAEAGSGGGDAPNSLDGAVDDVKEAGEKGENTRNRALQKADDIMNGSGGAGQAIRTIQGLGVVVTFYCIFRDIYVTAKDQVNQMLVGGAMGVANELNKTADCQKLGECDADQVGATAGLYDDGDKSFTESCGYKRATQEGDTGCEEINPQFTVVNLYDKVGGAGGTALHIGDGLLDPPVAGVDTACTQIMGPLGQGFLTAIGIFGLVASPGGSWATAGKAVAVGIGQGAATAGGKALIAHAILTYSGDLFKDLNPVDMGNLTDMGNMATASASCAATYCPQASNQDLAQLDREYRTERIAANSKRSVLEKFFDTTSADSVVTRVALNTPATPSATFGRIKTLFATIANPAKLNIALGKSTLALGGKDTAYAASDNGSSAYGLTNKVNAPPVLLPGSSSYDQIVAWGKTATLSNYSKYDKCASDSYAKEIGAEDDTCQWDGPMKSDGGRMYMQYKYIQNVAYKNALARNNQSSVEVSESPTGSTGTTEATNAKKGTDTSNMKCPANTADKGVFKTFNGVSIRICNVGGRTEVNASAAKAFYDMRVAAAAAGVTLDGGGFRSYEEQVSLRKKHCADWQNTPSNSCRPPTAKPGTSNHEEGLAVDFSNCSRGSAAFNWLVANASKYGIRNLPSESWHWSTTGG